MKCRPLLFILGFFHENLCKPADLAADAVASSDGSNDTGDGAQHLENTFLVFAPSNSTSSFSSFEIQAISNVSRAETGSRSLSEAEEEDTRFEGQVFCRYEYYRYVQGLPRRRLATDDKYFPINGSHVTYGVVAHLDKKVTQQLDKGNSSEDASMDEIFLKVIGSVVSKLGPTGVKYLNNIPVGMQRPISKYLPGGDLLEGKNKANLDAKVEVSDLALTVTKVLNLQRVLNMKEYPKSAESLHVKKLALQGIQQVIECYDEMAEGSATDQAISREEKEEREMQTRRREAEDRRRDAEDRLRMVENRRREDEDRRDKMRVGGKINSHKDSSSQADLEKQLEKIQADILRIKMMLKGK